MHGRGPVPVVELFVVRSETEGRDVVGEGIEPDVHHVVGVAGVWDPPFQRGAGDREVAETALHKADDLVVAAARTDAIGVRAVPLEQRFLVGREPEEVAALGEPLDRAAALEVVAVLDLRVRNERLVGRKVPALVLPLVYITGVGDAADDLGHRILVAGFGGADEVVVRDLEGLPQGVIARDHAVGELNRFDALLAGRLLDLLPVLVGAGEKTNIGAREPFVTGKDIRHNRCIDVPDVGHVVDVVDRCGDVVARVHSASVCRCGRGRIPFLEFNSPPGAFDAHGGELKTAEMK